MIENPLHTEIAKLRQRVEELELMLEYQAEHSKPDEEFLHEMRRAYGLTRQEARFVEVLLCGRIMTHESIGEMIVQSRDEDIEYDRLSLVMRCKVRKKIPWFSLEKVWGVGYKMAPEMIAKFKKEKVQ
ncbi:MAG: hypothetical protein ABJA10_02260 [Aestuariivirga sp.]